MVMVTLHHAQAKAGLAMQMQCPLRHYKCTLPCWLQHILLCRKVNLVLLLLGGCSGQAIQRGRGLCQLEPSLVALFWRHEKCIKWGQGRANHKWWYFMIMMIRLMHGKCCFDSMSVRRAMFTSLKKSSGRLYNPVNPHHAGFLRGTDSVKWDLTWTCWPKLWLPNQYVRSNQLSCNRITSSWQTTLLWTDLWPVIVFFGQVWEKFRIHAKDSYLTTIGKE